MSASVSTPTAAIRVGNSAQSVKADIATQPHGRSAQENVQIEVGDVTYRIAVTDSGALHISSESLDKTFLSIVPDASNRVWVQAVAGPAL